MRRAYNDEYTPPIPTLQVRFGNPEDGLFTLPIPGIVDTGADGTIVPIQLLREIEAAVEGQHNLRSQWGESRIVKSYVVDVEVEGVVLPGIWVVGDDIGAEVILGRDVLNRLKLLLDGLKLYTELVGY
jgi:predicted aspartyl protease